VSIDDLQRALDESLETASDLTASLFSDGRLGAAGVQAFINAVMAATVATVTREGQPHATVVLAACHDGTVIFTTSPHSLLLANLRRNPSVALTVTNPEHDVIVRGRARLLGKAPDLPDVMDRLHRLSKKGRFTPEKWPGYLYSIAIEKVFLS
jgi:nitroimidazol reductase NimA-like FMN-containing flavoprotein (pyridoxamine 5'-phosphate oxidase superfamily)